MAGYSGIFCKQGDGIDSSPLLAPSHDYFEDAAQQNKRDEKSRAMFSPLPIWLQLIPRDETCQRCGGYLNQVYVLNSRRLCRKCVKEVQGDWELVSGESMGSKMAVRIKAAKPESAPGSFIAWFIGLLGVKKVPSKEPVFFWSGIHKSKAPKRNPVNPSDMRRMPKYEGMMKNKKR